MQRFLGNFSIYIKLAFFILFSIFTAPCSARTGNINN